MAKSFRKTIQKALKARGWSGYKLGQESGVPIRTVQAYLAGEYEMTSDRLAAICGVLGLELRPVRKTRPARKGLN